MLTNGGKDESQQQQEWNSDSDLIAYFEKRLARSTPPSSSDVGNVKVQSEPSTVYYMDSPDNTDNAWKEIHLIHVHFQCTGDSNTLTDNLIRSNSNSPEAQSVRGNGTSSSNNSQSTLVWLISTEDLLVRIPMEQVPFMNAIIRQFQQQSSQQQKQQQPTQ